MKLKLLFVFSIVVFLIGIFRSVQNFSHTGAVDFRNRVVAARQANMGLNPYLFKWGPQYSERLLDPSEDKSAKYSRMTSPPTVLWFHSFFSEWNYSLQKLLNFILNWLTLLGIAFFVFWFFTPFKNIYSLHGLALFFVVSLLSVSGIWQFHVERGQQYIYFVFYIFLGSVLTSNASFCFSVLACFFRQTLVFTLFSIFKNKYKFKTILWVSSFGLLLLTPVLLKYPFEYWIDYFQTTRDWYARAYGLHQQIVPINGLVLPQSPEGIDTLSRYVDFFTRGNFLYKWLERFIGVIPNYNIMLFVALSFSVLASYLFYRRRNDPNIFYVIRLFSAIYVLDMLLPAPRSAYNGVFYFPVLMVGSQIVLNKVNQKELKNINQLSLLEYGLLLSGVGFFISLIALIKPTSSPSMVEIFYFLGAVLIFISPQQGQETSYFKSGGPLPTVDKKHQPHDTIEVLSLSKRGISEKILQLYESGHSLLAISERLNVSRWKARTILQSKDVHLRSQVRDTKDGSSSRIDRSIKAAPYGQCLVNGRLIDDPREQAVIQWIMKYRQLGLSHRAIARKLNSRKFKPRRARYWSQTLVSSIIKRISQPNRK